MSARHRSSTHDAGRHWEIPGDDDTEYFEYTKQYIDDFDKSGTLTFHDDIRDLSKLEQIQIKTWLIRWALKKHNKWRAQTRNPPPRGSTQIERKAVRNRQKLERDKEWIEAGHQAVLKMFQAVDELAAKEQEAEERSRDERLAAERAKQSQREATWSAGEAACRRKREDFAIREARRKDIEAKKNAELDAIIADETKKAKKQAELEATRAEQKRIDRTLAQKPKPALILNQDDRRPGSAAQEQAPQPTSSHESETGTRTPAEPAPSVLTPEHPSTPQVHTPTTASSTEPAGAGGVTGVEKDGAPKAGACETEEPETVRHTQPLRKLHVPKNWRMLVAAAEQRRLSIGTPHVQPPQAPLAPPEPSAPSTPSALPVQSRGMTGDDATEVDSVTAVDGGEDLDSGTEMADEQPHAHTLSVHTKDDNCICTEPIPECDEVTNPTENEHADYANSTAWCKAQQRPPFSVIILNLPTPEPEPRPSKDVPDTTSPQVLNANGNPIDYPTPSTDTIETEIDTIKTTNNTGYTIETEIDTIKTTNNTGCSLETPTCQTYVSERVDIEYTSEFDFWRNGGYFTFNGEDGEMTCHPNIRADTEEWHEWEEHKRMEKELEELFDYVYEEEKCNDDASIISCSSDNESYTFDFHNDAFTYDNTDSGPKFYDALQDYGTIQPKAPTTASQAFHVYDDSLDDIDQICYRTTTTGADFLTDHAVHQQTGVT